MRLYTIVNKSIESNTTAVVPKLASNSKKAEKKKRGF